MEDIEKTVASNTGLVYLQLHKFNRAYDPDAISVAFEALGKAAQTYVSSKGVSFATYASTCIYNAIGCYLRSLNKKRQLDIVYYEEPMKDFGDLTYADTIASNDTPCSLLIEKESISKIWEAFEKIISETSDGAAVRIIRCWQESDFTATQTDIAKQLNVSQAHVSRTLSAFKHKLKKELEEYLC